MSSIDDVIAILENYPLIEARRITNPGKYLYSVGFNLTDYGELEKQMDDVNGLMRGKRRNGVSYQGNEFEVIISTGKRRTQMAFMASRTSDPVSLLLKQNHSGVYELFMERLGSKAV